MGGAGSQTDTAETTRQIQNLNLSQNGPAPGSSAERVAAAVAAAVLAVQNSPTPSRLGRSASSAAGGGSLPVPTGIPEDQVRVIENVNRLMDEIAAERRAMTAALAAETEACEELRVGLLGFVSSVRSCIQV